MATRTESDPRYAQVNQQAARRAVFYKASAWEWVKANDPALADLIRAEGYRRYPPPSGRPGLAHAKRDYSFLEGKTKVTVPVEPQPQEEE